MKPTNHFFAAVALLAMLAVSCGENAKPLDKPEIKVDESSRPALVQDAIPFDAEAAQKVTFTANDVWTTIISSGTKADEASNWVKVTPDHGNAGTFTLNISMDRNTGSEPRSADIKIVCGDKSQTISITQLGVIGVESVSLDQVELKLDEKAEATLVATVKPDNAYNKEVEWSSSDEKVATVDNGKVTAVGVGSATITVRTKDGNKTATCEVTVLEVHEKVLLWEGGPYWATCNIGASKPEDPGLYFSWGNVVGDDASTGVIKDPFDDESYAKTPGANLTGNIPVDATYDAAYANWGEKWRMPTKEEFDALMSNCTFEWTKLNGVKGGVFTSKINGNSIFLPAAGYCHYGELLNTGSRACYWSSSNNYFSDAYEFEFALRNGYTRSQNRNCGQPVRPVSNQ